MTEHDWLSRAEPRSAQSEHHDRAAERECEASVSHEQKSCFANYGHRVHGNDLTLMCR